MTSLFIAQPARIPSCECNAVMSTPVSSRLNARPPGSLPTFAPCSLRRCMRALRSAIRQAANENGWLRPSLCPRLKFVRAASTTARSSASLVSAPASSVRPPISRRRTPAAGLVGPIADVAAKARAPAIKPSRGRQPRGRSRKMVSAKRVKAGCPPGSGSRGAGPPHWSRRVRRVGPASGGSRPCHRRWSAGRPARCRPGRYRSR